MIKKNGFILSLDATIGVLLSLIILLSGFHFFLRANEDFVVNLQMLKSGSDIVATLDSDGTLATFDKDEIQSGMTQLLPASYGMRILINSTYSPQQIISETESSPAGQKTVVGGKWFFYAIKDSAAYPSVASFEVWPK